MIEPDHGEGIKATVGAEGISELRLLIGVRRGDETSPCRLGVLAVADLERGVGKIGAEDGEDGLDRVRATESGVDVELAEDVEKVSEPWRERQKWCRDIGEEMRRAASMTPFSNEALYAMRVPVGADLGKEGARAMSADEDRKSRSWR